MPKQIKIFLLIGIIAFVVFCFKTQNVFGVPLLKEGSYLPGQTVSVWPSWPSLGGSNGIGLPVDPINQLTPAGTCSTTISRFCMQDSNCPVGEKCVLHDSITGWSTENRRFSFACATTSYAYRYIDISTSTYQVRARLEDTGLVIGNLEVFKAGFVSSSKFIFDPVNGICIVGEEVVSTNSGVCGDKIINLNQNEQCDPPGYKRYNTDVCAATNASTMPVQICNAACRWQTGTPESCSILNKCGNGIKEKGESCDDGVLNGKYNHCNSTCTDRFNLFCGDGDLTPASEICDPSVSPPAGWTVGQEKYAINKTDSCSADCQHYGPYCGDKITQAPLEQCDGGEQLCTVGGQQGVKKCNANCQYDACVITPVSPTPVAGRCGDTILNTDEVCDRGSENGTACKPAYNKTCSYCSSDCKNIIDVQSNQYCGNGIIEGDEKCDTDPDKGDIYSATSSPATSIFSGKIADHNGYKVKTCAQEVSGIAGAFATGDKVCINNCSEIKLKTGEAKCIRCGVDPNGVVVGGEIIDVVKGSGSDANPDPLYSLTNSGDNNYGRVQLWGQGARVARELISRNDNLRNTYVLRQMVTNYNPPPLPSIAKISPHSSCSTGVNGYKLAITAQSLLREIKILPDPNSKYDLVLSPILNKSNDVEKKQVRAVVSWEGSGVFVPGFLIPGAAFQPTVEGSSPQHNIIGYLTQDTVNGTHATGFTVNTGQMDQFSYSFYVRTPGLPITPFKNTAKLKVEIYIPESKSAQGCVENVQCFGMATKTFYLNTAIESSNKSAGYWHVFNLKKLAANAEVDPKVNIVDINAIISGPSSFVSEPDCKEHTGQVCRSAQNACDVAEVCQPGEDKCRPDEWKSAGTVCRAALSADCDVAETCDGTIGHDCPSDTQAPATKVCKGAAGVCDAVETCTNGVCPADAKKPNTTVCSDPDKKCQNDSKCDGVNDNCPVATVKSQGTVCRAAAGFCDITEVCDGNDSLCPSVDRFSSTKIFYPGDDCIKETKCTGNGAEAPSLDYKASGVACSPNKPGVCVSGAQCNGIGGCVDQPKPAGTSCGTSGHPICDPGETCDGQGMCQGNYPSQSTVCKPADPNILCDSNSYCESATHECERSAAPVGQSCATAACTVGGTCNSQRKCSDEGSWKPKNAYCKTDPGYTSNKGWDGGFCENDTRYPNDHSCWPSVRLGGSGVKNDGRNQNDGANNITDCPSKATKPWNSFCVLPIGSGGNDPYTRARGNYWFGGYCHYYTSTGKPTGEPGTCEINCAIGWGGCTKDEGRNLSDGGGIYPPGY